MVGRVVKERTFHLVPWLVWLSPPHARRVVKKRTSTPSTSDRQNNGFVYYPGTRRHCLSVCLSALPLISYLISISYFFYLSIYYF